MNPSADDEILQQIDNANRFAAQGQLAIACNHFSSARTMVVELADPQELRRIISGHNTSLQNESKKYRELLLDQKAPSGETLFIFSDSLALPRPENKSGPLLGSEATYGYKVAKGGSGRTVHQYAQRYWTTDDLVETVYELEHLPDTFDCVIHLGLNDCAKRMFTEPQRIGLQLYRDETRDKLVEFAQKHRKAILKHLPANQYVSLPNFRNNLSFATALLRRRGARRILLATTIIPPTRFWPATPGIAENFSSYNLEIMRLASEELGVTVIDLDRLMWESSHLDVLEPDGMHLSERGHEIFATQIINALGS